MLISTAFFMGLFGLVHCLTMCGSLSMALGFSIPREKSILRYTTYISFGRISGYALIGFIANYFSQGIISLSGGNVLYLNVFASLLMFGIGLHICNVSNAVLNIEKIGVWVNKSLEPIKKRLLPIDSVFKCLMYGLFWGFLPCGLVYTALSLALVAPSPLHGGAVMFMFGIATLPALIGMTSLNNKLAIYIKQKKIRTVFGMFIILMASYQLYTTWLKLQGLE